VILVLLAAILLRPRFAGQRVLEAQREAGTGPGVLRAPLLPKAPGLSVTEAPVPPPSDEGVLSSSAPPPPPGEKPPADIVTYLKKLREIEERRIALGSDFGPAMEMLREALGMRAAADEETRSQHSQSISGGYDTYYQKWDQLRADFDAIPAPAACQTLALRYRDALYRYSAAITRIWSAFKSRDMSALSAMRPTLQGDINRQLSAADEALDQLCQTYHIHKPFDIRKDSGLDSSLLEF